MEQEPRIYCKSCKGFHATEEDVHECARSLWESKQEDAAIALDYGCNN